MYYSHIILYLAISVSIINKLFDSLTPPKTLPKGLNPQLSIPRSCLPSWVTGQIIPHLKCTITKKGGFESYWPQAISSSSPWAIPSLPSFHPAAAAAVTSVVSDSVRPHRQQPTRLPHPWDCPGKNSGVGCHFLLQCMKVKSESQVAQSCPTLLRPHGLQPTRLLRPWDFPGKSTGVGCHCLLPDNTELITWAFSVGSAVSLLSACV